MVTPPSSSSVVPVQRRLRSLFLLSALMATPSFSQGEAPTLTDEVLALLETQSVVGRESAATVLIQQRLGGKAEQDRLGNLVLVVGSGSPRRLFAEPLDEPGFAISRIQADGYLRLVPLGDRDQGPLFDQFHFGQKVTIATRGGAVVGAIAIPSTHLSGLRRDGNGPFEFPDAFVDVGAESDTEVAELGIELLDTVTLIKRPVTLLDGSISGPAAALKASAISMVSAARRALAGGVDGTAVFAWTVMDSLNRKGLEAVVNRHGPFDEAILVSNRFEISPSEGIASEGSTLRPPHGLLIAGAQQGSDTEHLTLHTPRRPSPGTGGPHWEATAVRWIGLPSRFAGTPVETVKVADVESLAKRLGAYAGVPPSTNAIRPALPFQETTARPATTHQHTATLLGELVASAGVSGSEAPVRAAVIQRLPSWARPRVDAAGNVIVSLGPPVQVSNRAQHRVFVAHMDEVGFRVIKVLPDGRLELERRGGFYPWLWEAQAAVVRTETGDINGIFEPRADYRTTEERSFRTSMIVDVGAGSRERALALGVREGTSTVTMPKRMERIGRHRALARGFDDRVGTAALLLALERIDPKAIRRPVTVAWSVEEEVGLIGATALARQLGEVEAVYPIDTHVSSDSPMESDSYAYSRLGGGAVLRALESILFINQDDLDRTKALAGAKGLPLQIAMTHGGTDGQPFLAFGGRSIPLSWPGRYSHSPIEVMDLRDLDTLVDLVVELMLEPN